MKELILDGFFRCSGCGRRYHLTDTLESDACCDVCGQSLHPEIDEDQEETGDEHPNGVSSSGLMPEGFRGNRVKYSENRVETRLERSRNQSGTALKRSRNSL